MGRIFRTYFATMTVGSVYCGAYFAFKDREGSSSIAFFEAFWFVIVASSICGLPSLITELIGFKIIKKSSVSIIDKHVNYLRLVFGISAINLAPVFFIAIDNKSGEAFIGFAIASVLFSYLWFTRGLFIETISE